MHRFHLSRVVAGATVIFAVGPTLLVLISSFSGSKTLSFPPHDISLRAYGSFLEDDVIRAALWRSLQVGVLSVLIAVPAGVAAAFGLTRYRPKGRTFLSALLLLGLASPLVVSGVALLVLYTHAGLIGSVWPLAAGVSIVNLPFVVALVSSAIDDANPELEEAAATLGAEPLEQFLFVTLPGVMPGIIAAALLLFVFGITDFMISILVATVRNATLPVVVFGSLRGGLTPRLAAVGGIYIVIAFVVVGALSRTGMLHRFFFRED
ncbi:MAG: potC [Actinomycetia bacterium]|nr:potC [Actinomycetes bacterium]